MFCIKSDVITLESIEMYGFVTVWTSKDDGPYWVVLLMYGSHDMRHTGFRRLTVVNGTPRIWGVTCGHVELQKKLRANYPFLSISILGSTCNNGRTVSASRQVFHTGG